MAHTHAFLEDAYIHTIADDDDDDPHFGPGAWRCPSGNPGMAGRCQKHTLKFRVGGQGPYMGGTADLRLRVTGRGAG